MGIYNISAEELIDDFERFLQSIEGDVQAEVIAEAWNILSKKHKWEDTLSWDAPWKEQSPTSCPEDKSKTL